MDFLSSPGHGRRGKTPPALCFSAEKHGAGRFPVRARNAACAAARPARCRKTPEHCRTCPSGRSRSDHFLLPFPAPWRPRLFPARFALRRPYLLSARPRSFAPAPPPLPFFPSGACASRSFPSPVPSALPAAALFSPPPVPLPPRSPFFRRMFRAVADASGPARPTFYLTSGREKRTQ